MVETSEITAADTLARLAATRAGASRVFARHGLDYCCHGRISLREACAKKGLDVDALIRQLHEEEREDEAFERQDERPIPELLQHIVTRFHAPLRAELPRLLAMARRVEKVHGDKDACPRGLASLLERVAAELLAHMDKEELVLFPMLEGGAGMAAAGPIRVMEQEHDDHAENLAALREITGDYAPPDEACGTWRALYLGLHELEQELMQHIHLENHVLFPRALG